MKSCYDCDHFKARLPLKHQKNGDTKFMFKQAIATCEKMHMINETGGIKWFKDVFRSRARNTKTYEMAQSCQDYMGERY